MNNTVGAKASREEEIALLAMEQVLGIDIKLADAGAGDKKPDGWWIYPDSEERQGFVEITSPPAALDEWMGACQKGRAVPRSRVDRSRCA